MKDPWSIVGAGGEERRVLRPVEGRRESVTRTGQLSALEEIWSANFERVFPPKERLGRFMDQRDTLDDSQCLNELGRDGLGLILFVLWIRDNGKNKVKTQIRGTDNTNGDNSRSKFAPLLSNTSRCPVAEVTQIRSLDGTAYKKSLAGEIEPEEKNGDGELTIESSKVAVAETQEVKRSHSLLDSNPACVLRNSWNCGIFWGSLGTHIEAMRYSSCDSAVDLCAEVERDEHICGPGVVESIQHAGLSGWKRGD